MLKTQWEALGATVDIKTFNINTIESTVLRQRNFDALVFGEVMGSTPDPFPFWHSSQKSDPGLNLTEGELGLNLSNYDNEDADKLLEDNRKTSDPVERKSDLEQFQNIVSKDAPAVFLYSPEYIYEVSDDIKGINQSFITDPSQRFSDVNNWYIKTKRVLN